MSKHFSFAAEAEDDSDVVFRDVITLALLGFIALVIILLPHINPPEKKRTEQEVAAPGNVMIEARWDDDIDADVDLWVQGPQDRPVGYSNLAGEVFNLLRDDIGFRNDVSQLNYENAYSRGIVEGEYTVNLHMYFNRADSWPVPVTVLVSTVKPSGTTRTTRQILVSEVELRRLGEELTVFNFQLDADGELVDGSVGSAPRKLVTAPTGGYNFDAYKQ
ncbi:hypothetical protein TspCOW1_03960 [Thiohalobacter sp. COW1]|uniref:Zn-dependent protease n=1 Tax=Thiohalobacter thiocyanaticus TaxID=585455 RepID=A0A1Z4VTH9_9GAMM|nr:MULTISPECIES: hypothetical protein [Thiohalobacter]BAZ94638.1 Zn-dependent protease [Thiohalobacter thiocyanaticus]BCO30293.1 hypothetical protein TspCOW1_03960 [Thiohalobacter sp. COW1]